MQKSPTLLICLALSLTAAKPATAAIDAAGAASLKKTVESEIDWRKAAATVTGKGLSTGPVTVTPKSSFYEVKIPSVVVALGPQGRLKVGDVTMNATPGKGDEWMVSVALPPKVAITDRADQTLATATIGKQKFAGAWRPALGFFPRFDSSYQNIVISDAVKNEFKITVGSLRAVSNLTDADKGLLGGTGGYEVKDIILDSTTPAGMMRLSVNSLNVTTAYDGMDTGRAAALRAQIASAAPAPDSADNQELTTFISTLLPIARSTAHNVTTSMEAAGFSLSGKDEKGQANGVDIAKITAFNSLTGLDQEKAQAVFKTQLSAIKAQGPANGLMPENVNIEATAGNLPARKLMASLLDTLQKSITLVKTSQAAPGGANAVARLQMTNFVSALPQTLQEAGAYLDFKNSYARNADIDFNLDGHIVADATALNGATGKMTLTATGLENALQKMQQSAAQPGADPRLALYSNILMALGMTGLTDRAPDGRLIHRYTFEITNDNKMLLNNMNLQQFVRPSATP